MDDTIPVRAGEALDLSRLEDFLRRNLGKLPSDPLEIRQFSAGHSNLTYSLHMGEWEAVLRRPPFGPVAPKAHNMEREFAVLQAIHPFFPFAPKPILYSEDEAVGSPFFLMERKHGVVFDEATPDGIEVTPELGRKLSQQLVDELVRLHQIDYRATSLLSISKPEGFMKRQVEGWISRYLRAKTDEVAGADELMRWLNDHVPADGETTVIHYDYKFNNVMFSEDLSRMVGVFDWEMATVGDPLADLGAALSYWIEAEDPDWLKVGFQKLPITVMNGFMTRNDFIEAYAKKSGRDVARIHYYVTFAFFKLAVIVQQIYYRYKMGQTQDPRFAEMNRAVAALVTYAMENKPHYA